jgi:hypothetical protein
MRGGFCVVVKGFMAVAGVRGCVWVQIWVGSAMCQREL